jgi:murein L,D-transpeptidase YcbB/YkuD
MELRRRLSVQSKLYGCVRRAAGAAAASAFALAMLGHAAAQPAAPPDANAPPASSQPAQPAAAQIVLRPEQVSLLEAALAKAETHGFDPGEFSTANLDPQLQSHDAITRQLAQQTLVAAVLRYARAVHVGRLADEGFIDDWGLRPNLYDPTPGFSQAVAQDRLGTWLDSLPPPYTGYQTLMQGLAAYRAIEAKGGWKPVSAGPDLKVGSKSDRVLELRARLAAEDAAVNASGPDTFDDDLAKAVMRSQKRFGLEDNGVVNARTLQALNVSLDDRIDQILANLERWRWLPPELPTDRIQVNIAAAILTVFHADSPTLSMRAVTGRPGDETPMLQSQIESIVFNPPWNVPSSIASREIWPKERAHPGYLASHDFVVVHTGDGGTRLQQRAGRQSALGRIKFDFPNPYGVYLHDTPTQKTFSRFSRLESHGCVRLQKPLVLANALLQGDPVWTPDAVDAAIAAGKTVRAPLTQPISVFLFYWTAYLGPDGQMNFRDDPYDWDKLLIDKLHGGSAPQSPA